MVGIPVWAIQLIIAFLKTSGAIGWAGALSAKLIVATESKLSKLKTYHNASDFPSGVNGQTTPPVVSIQAWRKPDR